MNSTHRALYASCVVAVLNELSFYVLDFPYSLQVQDRKQSLRSFSYIWLYPSTVVYTYLKLLDLFVLTRHLQILHNETIPIPVLNRPSILLRKAGHNTDSDQAKVRRVETKMKSSMENWSTMVRKHPRQIDQALISPSEESVEERLHMVARLSPTDMPSLIGDLVA